MSVLFAFAKKYTELLYIYFGKTYGSAKRSSIDGIPVLRESKVSSCVSIDPTTHTFLHCQKTLTMFVGVVALCAVLITQRHNSHKHSQNP